MSKVVRIHELGAPEVLRIEELEAGEPGAGEVRINVEAIGLNRAEALFRSGGYFSNVKLPSLMGYECSGTVDAVGEGVKDFALGARVCVVPVYRLGEYGVYGEKAIVPARSLLPMPDGLSAIEAAAVWMPYLTAFAIIEIANTGIGDYVVIPAASSSVGLAAIQLANWAGGVPIALTRRSGKFDALKAHGAQHVIATEEMDVVAEVMRITHDKGARVVFDPVAGPFVETLAKAMAEEGILFIYGSLSNRPTVFPHWDAALKSLSLRGWVASSIWNKPNRYARAQSAILKGLATGRLKPTIARTFALEQIVEAHRYLESNQQVGKIVVTVS
jgi:NADPH:quinone reductase-like Zn-dependent oxidoreductase